MRRQIVPLIFMVLVALSYPAQAERFELLSPDDDIIGQIQVTRAYEKDTLIDIAREFDLGYDQIVKANPKVNRWVPGHNTKVRLPSMYILPDAPREGIILNLPELRIYYFPKGSSTSVYTFPVSVGRMDWRTPMGLTKVIRKDKDPAWYPPESIRAEHARDGDPLPKMIAGGIPENPLGRYALRLGKAGYLIHGTDERKSFGIGMRVTHGCLRMYPEDIEQFFNMVPVGTKVNIIDQPIKVGRRSGKVYLEAHLPFEEEEAEPTAFELQSYRNVAYSKIGAAGIDEFNPTQIREIIEQGSGIPIAIDLGGDGYRQARYPQSRDAQEGGRDDSYRVWDKGPQATQDDRYRSSYEYSEPRLPGQGASGQGSYSKGPSRAAGDGGYEARGSNDYRGSDEQETPYSGYSPAEPKPQNDYDRGAPRDYGDSRGSGSDSRGYRARSVPPSPYSMPDDSVTNYERSERRDRYDSSNLDRADPDLKRYESDLERSYRKRDEYHRRRDSSDQNRREEQGYERLGDAPEEETPPSSKGYSSEGYGESKPQRGWNLW